MEQPINFFAGRQEVPDATTYDNDFEIQWEFFLKHAALDEPFPYNKGEKKGDPAFAKVPRI